LVVVTPENGFADAGTPEWLRRWLDVDKLLIARARGLGKRNIVQGITQVLENDIFGLTGVDSAG
jgi:hypothetical protein